MRVLDREMALVGVLRELDAHFERVDLRHNLVLAAVDETGRGEGRACICDWR